MLSGVWFDTVGTVDRLPERVHHVFPARFNLAHLSRVIVIVSERVVDVCHVQVVSISDGFGINTALFDKSVHLPDTDAMSRDMGLTHEIMSDATTLPFGHTPLPPDVAKAFARI
jgi:hypothetical protein